LTSIASAPPQRNIDNSELAFNTVLDATNPALRETAVAALAAALKIEREEAETFLQATRPVPVARSHNYREAEMIASLVQTCGLVARVVADQDLRLETELVRARRIERREGEIEVHHISGSMTLPVTEIKLMVMGALRSVRVDYTESGSARPGQPVNILDTAEFRSDEMLLDVYAESLERSFRIRSDAFDYSGLVWPLSFRAEVNFQAAIGALRSTAPQAVFDDDFTKVKSALARAWPERTRNEAQGIKRAGLSYRPVAKSSVVSDNRNQFDRYSRLVFLSLI
jgi:hypothetical protein